MQERIYQRYRKDVLLIDSMMESGNLLQADRITSDEYHMYMQVDTNTKGHQQWFYFRVRNTKKDRKYQFHIMNFTKPGVTGSEANRKSELTQRVVFRSKISGKSEWSSIGPDQLQFVKSRVQRRKKDVIAAEADSDQDEEAEQQFAQEAALQTGPNSESKQPPLRAQSTIKKKKVFYYYSLVFNVEFENDQDTVYFAFSHPYTYTQILKEVLEKEDMIKPLEGVRLLNYNDGITEQQRNVYEEAKNGPKPFPGIQFENKNQLIFYRRQELCRSVCNLPIWQITITRDSQMIRKRPIILITSRVHSGETPASYVFKGMLDFLLSDKKEAKLLRKLYTFVMIPCLNPDGLICGNYRNSLAGVDLNRQWIQPDEEFQPEIFHVKNLLKRFTEIEKRQIWIYCDIHGHSKKKNSFFYGCNTAANGGFLSWTIVRLLPRIFAQKSHMFNFKDCRFKVEPYKIGTGRVVAWKQFQITHSFTLETSFFGYDFGEDESREFSEEDYNTVGMKFCDSVYEFHYVWKQIQKELNITNGWLKPRVLLEITGIPAAQLLKEEQSKKKRAIEKLIAIQQYQQFLAKFFNGNSKSLTKFQPKSLLNVPGQSLVRDGESDIISSGQKRANRANIMQSLPIYSPTADDDVDQDVFNIEKCLTGLVKIQALIRGVITRAKMGAKLAEINKRTKLMQIQKLSRGKQQIIITDDKNRQNGQIENVKKLKSRSFKSLRPQVNGETIDLDAVLLDDSEDTTPGASNPLESRDSLSNSGFGRLSSRRFELLNRDWRGYFQETELEKAFQIVEIEQRDISEEDSQSGGSASDPSDDNLDKNEILQNVYVLNKEEAGKKLNEIKTNKINFLKQIRSTSPITASQLYNRLRQGPTDLATGSGVNAVRNAQTKAGGKILSKNNKDPSYANQNANSNHNVFQESPKKLNTRLNQSNFQSQNTLARRGLQSPYTNAPGQSGIVTMSQVLQQNFDINFQQEPMSRVQSNLSQVQGETYSNEYHISQRQMWKNGKSLQSALLESRVQERAQTSYGLVNGLVGPIANSILVGLHGPIQPRINTNALGQLKLIQLNQKAYGKRDNINQVIKDCFITRKCGIKQPASKQVNKQMTKTTANWHPEQVSEEKARREAKSISAQFDPKQREFPSHQKQTVGNATKEQPNFRLEHPVLNNFTANNQMKKLRRSRRPKSPYYGQVILQTEVNKSSFSIEKQPFNTQSNPKNYTRPGLAQRTADRISITRDQIRIHSGQLSTVQNNSQTEMMAKRANMNKY